MPVVQSGKFLVDSPSFLISCLPHHKTIVPEVKTLAKNIKLLMDINILAFTRVKFVLFVLLFMQH